MSNLYRLECAKGGNAFVVFPPKILTLIGAFYRTCYLSGQSGHTDKLATKKYRILVRTVRSTTKKPAHDHGQRPRTFRDCTTACPTYSPASGTLQNASRTSPTSPRRGRACCRRRPRAEYTKSYATTLKSSCLNSDTFSAFHSFPI